MHQFVGSGRREEMLSFASEASVPSGRWDFVGLNLASHSKAPTPGCHIASIQDAGTECQGGRRGGDGLWTTA